MKKMYIFIILGLVIIFGVGYFWYKSSKILKFSGSLNAGETYEAVWPIDDMVLANLPYHHAYNLDWTNIASFPNLKPGTKFVFKVNSAKTSKVATQYRWNNEYVCEILEVKKMI